MSEEKCDHEIGLGVVQGLNCDVVDIVSASTSNVKAMVRKFEFCPLCGVEIEGDLT